MGMGRSAAGQLFSGMVQSFVLGMGWQCLRLGFSQVNSLSLLLSHSLSCCLGLAPSDCSQGIQAGPYPKQAARSFPFSAHLLVADASLWGTFLLGVAFRYVICEFYFFPPG